MKFDSKYKIYDVDGEHVVLQPRLGDTETSRVIAFNESSLFLWNRFCGTQFDEADLVAALLGEYDVDPATAHADVADFVAQLRHNSLLAQE